MRTPLLAATAALVSISPATAAPVFLLNDTGGVGPGTQARAGFEAAAARWASLFSDDAVIRLDVGFRALGSGILGQAGSTRSDLAYSTVRSALRDNRYLGVSTANQKALGLRGDTGARDASIAVSTAFSWDFDPANSVSRSAFDLVGVAAHEIGHALGFVSGLDHADARVGGTGLDNTAWTCTASRTGAARGRWTASPASRPAAAAARARSRRACATATAARRTTGRTIAASASWTRPRRRARCCAF